jgi:hypothetical protein
METWFSFSDFWVIVQHEWWPMRNELAFNKVENCKIKQDLFV